MILEDIRIRHRRLPIGGELLIEDPIVNSSSEEARALRRRVVRFGGAVGYHLETCAGGPRRAFLRICPGVDTIRERSLISNGRGLLALTSDLIRIARVRESTS